MKKEIKPLIKLIGDLDGLMRSQLSKNYINNNGKETSEQGYLMNMMDRIEEVTKQVGIYNSVYNQSRKWNK